MGALFVTSQKHQRSWDLEKMEGRLTDRILPHAEWIVFVAGCIFVLVSGTCSLRRCPASDWRYAFWFQAKCIPAHFESIWRKIFAVFLQIVNKTIKIIKNTLIRSVIWRYLVYFPSSPQTEASPRSAPVISGILRYYYYAECPHNSPLEGWRENYVTLGMAFECFSGVTWG